MKESEMKEEEARQLFDPVNKTFDGRKLKVTDLPFNPRVTLHVGYQKKRRQAWR